jgi:hypothetical protein
MLIPPPLLEGDGGVQALVEEAATGGDAEVKATGTPATTPRKKTTMMAGRFQRATPGRRGDAALLGPSGAACPSAPARPRTGIRPPQTHHGHVGPALAEAEQRDAEGATMSTSAAHHLIARPNSPTTCRSPPRSSAGRRGGRASRKRGREVEASRTRRRDGSAMAEDAASRRARSRSACRSARSGRRTSPAIHRGQPTARCRPCTTRRDRSSTRENSAMWDSCLAGARRRSPARGRAGARGSGALLQLADALHHAAGAG